MFNLLRRTRQRKAHKNKNYDVSDDEEASAAAAAASVVAVTASKNESGERRYLFSAAESSEERTKAPPPRRAVIEELEDFGSDDDEEHESVKLAKTAAASDAPSAAATVNGHTTAISWRSDNLYINNMGGGNGATTARTSATNAVAVGVAAARPDEHNDRDAAVGHGSQNEAATAYAKGAQLIANGTNIKPINGGNAQQQQQSELQQYQQQQQRDRERERERDYIAGTVINAESKTKSNTNSKTETQTAIDTVIYRQSKQSNNEQKRLSRLSLGNFLSSSSNKNSGDSACEESVPKKRKTLQKKGRDFLSDIFMARGRNHQRHQQQQQQQQQHQKQPPQSIVKSKTDDVIAIGQALTTQPTALATAHLETNSDPATVSTNSYQMTMSNNSATKRQQQQQQQQQQQHQQQSAEEQTEQSNSNSAGAIRQKEQQQQQQREHTNLREYDEQWHEQQRQRQQQRATATIAEFIQAANVERCTVAEDQQQQQQHPSQVDAAPNNSNSNSDSSSYINSRTNSVLNSESSMGQTSAKPNEFQATTSSSSAHSSRASTPREFRESVVSDAPQAPQAPPRHRHQELPKITVVDCSFEQSPSQSPEAVAEEIFYELEQPRNGINIEELNEAHVETLEDDVFSVDIPTTVYQQTNGGVPRPWTRLTNVKLENVQEEEEEEHDEDELDEALDLECDERERATPNGSRQSASSERSALKSDSNLSSSYADSGIGIGETRDMPPPPPQPSRAATSQQPTAAPPLRTPFVRDANSTSTDCDCGEELLLQCDELDDERHFSERLVCIESISLPDVVVESTTGATATTTAAGAAPTAAATTAATTTAATNDCCNINITNGAGGNSLGNVHFIPIHIEGSGYGSAVSGSNLTPSRSRSRSSSPNQKHRSLDDSCIGRNSVEIVEDGCILNNVAAAAQETQDLKKELNLQKARFSTQLEDAHKNVQNLEAKVSDMQLKIQNLEQEISLKQWNVDRLQSELSAAQKDDEYVRKKLKLVEDEKLHLRHKYSDDEDEFRRKYNALEAQYNELTEKYKETQSLAGSLQTQLASAKQEVEDWRIEVDKIRQELEEQIRILKSALEYSEAERKICEDKWQKEFEMLRTHNREREETLMSDCEWQMRQMQRQCKDKIDKSNYDRKQASAKAEELELELQSRRKEAEHLRICQAQVKSLSGVVSEQERSIQTLMERIENLKGELEMANENLESQIEAVRKIKYQCDNAIYDKERQMIYRIDEVRNEAASFWENKLYTEMTRLTNELESVYVDERRDALDKLQAEHIEELRALTNRYTANEEELRAEIDELSGNLELKKQDFLALRERSDNALLQTRMHLDRADREYQNAMCREEDRRVELEEKLKKEFDSEKEDMEEKFRERLGQVKEEFAKELQLSTQDMIETHRKELETQKAKLQAEKDEALQTLVERHRAKLTAAEERMNDVELRHQRNLKDLKAAYDAEKAALDKRDISNANEIEQLHRKCRCLTNLFEEMRMRYERRDPRPEDLKEISELRTRCDSQERDLYVLTDRLRDMQIQMSELQQQQQATNGGESLPRSALKKPPSKTIPTSCDVIYEENEERESPEQDNVLPADEEVEPSDTESNHTIEVNGKCINDRINEDDAHMISAV